MKFSWLLLMAAVLSGCSSQPQAQDPPQAITNVSSAPHDLGAQIEKEDAELGPNPGQILITASGTISEGRVSLSAGHDLVCDHQGRGPITIFLDAGSYIYQNSYTHIENCVISSTSTPVLGEVQSVNTEHVELNNVTFVGGGTLVYWDGVTNFLISSDKIASITAVGPGTRTTQSGIYLVNCSGGQINDLLVSGFIFPAGSNITASAGIVGINHSNDITVNNPIIRNVDASYVPSGVGAILIRGSTNIAINGGVINGNANMDGVLSELYENTPSYGLTITGLNSSYNGGRGANIAAHGGLGDGIDLIDTGHVSISHCILRGSGSLRDEQPGIWMFLDDDVVVADSDISDGSMAGVAIAGSPNVSLLGNSINRNQATGVFTEWQAGKATNEGSAVTFATGVSGGFGLSWVAGTPFVFDGATYEIASVFDSTHLTLTTSPPDHSSPVDWAVNSINEEIIGDVIDDNGLARFGSQQQVGISWADGTSGVISGVTATDTGAGTQLYALEFAQTASAVLAGDNFSGNVEGGNGICGTDWEACGAGSVSTKSSLARPRIWRTGFQPVLVGP